MRNLRSNSIFIDGYQANWTNDRYIVRYCWLYPSGKGYKDKWRHSLCVL